MCGIVGAVSSRNIVPILVQGLQRLEYRGYDSCGVAVHAASLDAASPAGLRRARSTARVAELLEQVRAEVTEPWTMGDWPWGPRVAHGMRAVQGRGLDDVAEAVSAERRAAE